MSGIGRVTLPVVWEWLEALSDVRELLRGPPKSLGGPPGCPGVVGSLSRVSGCGRETLPDVREWSEGPLECPGGLEDVREWSEGPPGCPGMVG